ncbi:MAG: LPXTG cell wall anchor domain-containing protein [Chloroflexi bacterium]|nr:LPXTG cell wall anchor domain-containing protein [Chloroflexota bacterium]
MRPALVAGGLALILGGLWVFYSRRRKS